MPKSYDGPITNKFTLWSERHNTNNPEPRAMRLDVVSVTTAEIEVCSFAHSLNKQTFSEHLVCARHGAVQRKRSWWQILERGRVFKQKDQHRIVSPDWSSRSKGVLELGQSAL